MALRHANDTSALILLSHTVKKVLFARVCTWVKETQDEEDQIG